MGAYPAQTSVAYLVGDLYKCPNVLVEETQAYLNAGPNRAFRAPGYPQSAWALEQMMDALANKLGIDPIELRLKNLSAVCQMAANRPYTSTGLRQCLEEGANGFDWAESRNRPKGPGPWISRYRHGRRHLGLARRSAVHRHSPALCRWQRQSQHGRGRSRYWHEDRHGHGGIRRVGDLLGRIQVENADTGTTQFTRPSGGSKTVFADSPAVRSAALEVKARILEIAAAQLKVPVGNLALKDGQIVSVDGSQKLAIGELRQLQQQQVVVGVGVRGPDPTDKVVRPFVAHFAEVEVNTLTGEFRVVRMLAAQDSGRVMNLLTYRNQVFGGMIQGIGYATSERRVLQRRPARW